MTTAIVKRSFADAVFREPFDLAKAQPHQVLLSTGSVAIMAQFAAHGGIVDPLIGYCIAIGVEWAYLRGLASDTRSPTAWGSILNWSAFGIVVLWGILWVATIYGAVPPRPGGWAALTLAGAHIIPIAWIALCSAQCHRAMLTAEHRARDRAATEQAERDRIERERRTAFDLEQEEEDRKLARWKDAYQLKSQMRADVRPVEMPEAQSGTVPEAKGKTARCAKCKKDVAWSTPSEAGTIRRWGCGACRAKKVNT